MHDNQQADQLDTLNAADSARPGRSLADPLGRALYDMPLPAGLAGRILDRLAASSSAAAPSVSADDRAVALASDPAVVEHAPNKAARRRGRRLVMGGLLATAATLLLAWLGYEQFRPVWPGEVLLEQVVLFHEQDARQAEPLNAWPLAFSNQIARPAGAAAGLRLPGLPGRRGTAYTLRSKKPRATLYVVSVRAVGLPAAPPRQAALASRGHAAAAWQEGSLAYILVVEGGQSQYRQVVEPQQPIAFAFLPSSAN